MNPRYLLLLLVVCLLVGSVQAWGADMGAWDYRKEITVNNTGSNLTNYQVLFTVNRSAGSDSGFTVYLDGKCESDYDDIRFTTSDENTLCDYWIESNSSTVANIWVEIPSIPNSTAYGSTKAYLYYGNTGASAVSNGANAFPLFDDFLGSSINSTKWASYTGTGSTIVVSGGVITFTTVSGSGDRYAGIKSSDTFGVGYCVNTRQKSGDAGNRAYKYSTFGHGSDRESGMTLGAAMSITDGIIFRDRSSSNANWYARRFSGTSFINESMLDDTTSTNYKIYEIARTDVGAVSTWFIDGVSKYTSGGTEITSSLPVTYGIDNLASTSGVDAVDYVDWIFVRKYAATEPTVSAWGSEEEAHFDGGLFPEFSGVPTSGYVPLTVYFTDESTSENCTIDTWQWSLGDSTPNSTQQNPAHTYTTSGLYNVGLTITNTSLTITNSTTKTAYINATINLDAPNADFTVTETCGDVSDTFYFIDFSTGGGLYAWNWSFGDGAYSELRNPTHQYASNGTYDVNLSVWGAYGVDSLVRSNLITIPCGAPTPTPTPTPTPDPVADFTANITVWCSPATVMFTSTSTGTAPLTYDWDICGDYYDTPTVSRMFSEGVYTISLNVSNALGYDEEIKTNYITVLNCGGGTPTPTATPTPTPTQPPTFNGTGIFNITESHGATWVRWEWVIPDSHLSSNVTYMRVIVDGEEKYNMSMVDAGDRSQLYTLSDVSPNEFHKLELREVSLADPTIEYVVASDDLVAKTDYSLDFYVILLIVGSGLFLVSLYIRDIISALVVASSSTALFAYVAVMATKSYSTMSTLGIILSVASLFVVIYLIYVLYKRHVIKEVDDV